MRNVLAGLALLGCGLLTPSAVRGDEPATGDKHRQILKSLSGTWKIVAGANQGRKLSKEHLDGSRVLIQNNSIVVLDPDEKEIYRAKYQVNLSTTPYEIDMTSDMPNVPKSLAVGIFELRKDGWRLCYGLPGEDRPKKFASPDGGHVMLFSMAKADTTRDDKIQAKPIKAETIKEYNQQPAGKKAEQKAEQKAAKKTGAD